jgi:hypothetical protein
MANRLLKNTRKKFSITSDNKRKIKKGSSLPKKPNKSDTAHFYEVRFWITKDEYDSGKPFFEGPKYLPKFAVEAYREKVKRAEAADRFTKKRSQEGNIKFLEPILQEMFKQGKLDFLNEK